MLTRTPGAGHGHMGYDFNTLRGDIFGGVTSMVVALPISLAFGVASGLGAAAGLYGAIAVGFFASVFGGTRSQISGPTGPITVALAVIVTKHAADLTEALTIVVLAGLLQVLLGISRVGRFVAYTPYVVISGFMSGVGIIIMLIQAMPFLGAPTAPGGPMGAAGALPEAVANINFSAFAIAAVELTRFCGHLQTVRRRCSDGENSFTLRAGVPAPDGRAGSLGPYARGAGPGVRVFRFGDSQLGASGRPGRRPS